MSDQVRTFNTKDFTLNHSIILIGLPGGGKTTAASFLKSEFEFESVSAGDIVRSLCIAEGITTTRENLSKYGQRLLRKYGFQYFGKLLLNQANKFEKVIFEGIRPPEVVSFLKSQIPKTLVIYIEASEKLRMSRLVSRGEDESNHKKVMKAPMENEIIKYKPLSDVVIENQGDLDLFYHNLKQVVSKFIQSGS